MKTAKKTLSDLELLFEFVSSHDLKRDLTYLVMQLIILNPPHKQPKKELYENIFFLMDFLDKVDKQ